VTFVLDLFVLPVIVYDAGYKRVAYFPQPKCVKARSLRTSYTPKICLEQIVNITRRGIVSQTAMLLLIQKLTRITANVFPSSFVWFAKESIVMLRVVLGKVVP
jgi:hypothetical protein